MWLNTADVFYPRNLSMHFVLSIEDARTDVCIDIHIVQYSKSI